MKTHPQPSESYGTHARYSNPYWWQRLFATIDAGNAHGFVEWLTPDAEFRLGNATAVRGCAAIEPAVSDFFGAIRSSRHELIRSWDADDCVGCEGEVTYTRHDGSLISYPFVNVLRLRGEKICSYRIFIDISTLFATLA